MLSDEEIPSVCPQCLAHHDRMSDAFGDARPTDGDVNICIICRGISVYDSTVPTLLRFPTDEELEEFRNDPRLSQIRWAMTEVDRIYGPPKGKYYPNKPSE